MAHGSESPDLGARRKGRVQGPPRRAHRKDVEDSCRERTFAAVAKTTQVKRRSGDRREAARHSAQRQQHVTTDHSPLRRREKGRYDMSTTPVATETHKATLNVIYNGRPEQFPYHGHEQVNALLQQALNAFKITANRHLMSLFDEAGRELNDQQSLEAAGVKPGATLILRQSVVKGG
jgi:hypothetical protein